MRVRKVTATRPARDDQTAVRVGERLRAARLAAGLTQQQLAGDRYTKAYVSALEHAHVRPSVVALDYLAERLGTTASRLLASDDDPRWGRLDADLLLAAGRWQPAADAYSALAERAVDRAQRAELLRGLAEARYRQSKPLDAERAAAEAVAIFEKLGREEDAALASYWLSAALYAQDNSTEAKAILVALLGRVRAGMSVEPGFKLRLLMAIATNEAREGNHSIALSYLEEVRSLADSLDDRRRAIYLFDLAYSYRATGDFEGALRAGYASLALFSAVSADAEVANTENDLALAHLALGKTARAEELATSARGRLERLEDERLLAHVTETEAQIAASREDWAGSIRLAEAALQLADRTSNPKAAVSALLTLARGQRATDDVTAALASYEQAGRRSRELGHPALIRRALGAWADALAETGNHAGAYQLTREALAAS